MTGLWRWVLTRSVLLRRFVLIGLSLALLASAILLPAVNNTGPASALTVATEEATTPEATTPRSTTPQSTPQAPRAASSPPALTGGAPTISSPPDGKFIGRSTTTITGTREIGQDIQLFVGAEPEPTCLRDDDGTTTWTCPDVPLPNGAAVVVRVLVPDPSGQSELTGQISISVLGAPTVLGGPSGQPASNGLVRGTGEPGASVSPVLPNGQTCVATADSAGNWACFLEGPLTSGSVAVTASQTKPSISGPSSSNDSAAVTMRFDADRPAAPVLTSPTAGARVSTDGAVYSGTGETGATVTVFAGAYSVCTAVVLGGSWQCSAGGVAAGTYNVIAAQQDEAGNLSSGSPAVSVVYGAAPASAAPAPTRTPTGEMPAPPTDPADPGADAPGPAASAEPAPAPPAATAGPEESEAEGDDEDTLATVKPGTWKDPTRFTAAIASPLTAPDYPWLRAVLLAVGAILLLAIPARLLAGTITRARGGRPIWGGGSLAGRNRVREEFETAPTVRLNRWLQGGAALVAAATLVMLSGPIVSEPAYLRLLVAVVIALFLVNLVAAITPLSWGSRVLKADATITFLPRYLLLIFLTAIASRVFDVQPALLFGLLGSVTVVAGATSAHRGQLATVRAASLIGFAVLGWVLLGVLPEAASLGTALISEVVNTAVLASIGSAVFILIPIGSTSGRSILVWSPLAWVGLTLAALTVLFGVLSPMVALWHGNGTIALLWVAAAGFAALSCGAWAWQRFVAPVHG